MTAHISVLLQPILTYLTPAEHVIDGTLGAGGHSRALLDAGVGAVLGLDVDPLALELARARLADYGERAIVRQSSYAQMKQAADQVGWQSVDGILLDVGVSSMQLDHPERGFAFMQDGPLDMRFNPQGDRPAAAELVNQWDEHDLADVIYRYGEDHHSRKLARAIVAARPLHTTRELATLIERVTPRRKGDKIHPATRVFQALRIAVNDELAVLEQALTVAMDLLAPGGRLAVISFHSLEDRIVKHSFRLASTDCICPPKTPLCVCGHRASVQVLTRKPIEADEAEVAVNPRSRSAKLRVVEKL